MSLFVYVLIYSFRRCKKNESANTYSSACTFLDNSEETVAGTIKQRLRTLDTLELGLKHQAANFSSDDQKFLNHLYDRLKNRRNSLHAILHSRVPIDDELDRQQPTQTNIEFKKRKKPKQRISA